MEHEWVNLSKILLTLKRQHHKMVKNTQMLTNCLSVFDHFVGLALKELTKLTFEQSLTRNEQFAK